MQYKCIDKIYGVEFYLNFKNKTYFLNFKFKSQDSCLIFLFLDLKAIY